MMTTTTYNTFDLTDGVCPSCGEDSDEIYVYDPEGRCIDCIQEQEFYESTMRGIYDERG